MRVGVIGAGPAGLTAAELISRAGHEVVVYEADNAVGGMAKTFDLWGQKVDLGPHRFFSSDPRVNAVWFGVVAGDYDLVRRLTRILYMNLFFYYPLKPFDALKKLGPIEATRCMFSYLVEKIFTTAQDGSFETWVAHRFGRRLYEIFFKTYTEKLWGMNCNELDADFAAQRIKKMSLTSAIWNALVKGRGNKHKTLVDEFSYPHGGAGIPYQRLADKLIKNGGKVYLSMPVKRVVTENGRAVSIETEMGDVECFDHVISTMPLTHLVERLEDAPVAVQEQVKKLRFRNTILVYLKIEGQNLFPDNWLYVHSPDLLTGRLTNFRNWTPKINGTETATIVAFEYWCYDNDLLWKSSDSELIELGKRELIKTGLIGETPISSGLVRRIHNSYPVYRRNYKDVLAPVIEYLKTIKGLTPIGRGGSFKYNNQDHSILMGIFAAENLLKGTSHDLWLVNTDDDYQESATLQ
jgi:protoporphyrinogen oxidase